MSFRAPLRRRHASATPTNGSPTSAPSKSRNGSDSLPTPVFDWWEDDGPSTSGSTTATTAGSSSGSACGAKGPATPRSYSEKFPRGSPSDWCAKGAGLSVPDRSIERFRYRSSLFLRRQMSQAESEAWADRLIYRDANVDERRLCEECSNYTPSVCLAAQRGELKGVGRQMAPLRKTLQRCPSFDWQKPS